MCQGDNVPDHDRQERGADGPPAGTGDQRVASLMAFCYCEICTTGWWAGWFCAGFTVNFITACLIKRMKTLTLKLAELFCLTQLLWEAWFPPDSPWHSSLGTRSVPFGLQWSQL